MRNYFNLAAIMFSGILLAQETNPVLTAEGNKVKATYYHENGKVAQEGYFENGKLEGVWTSYDEAGKKKAIAEYANGQKTGKWYFYEQDMVREVSFNDSRIVSVKENKTNTGLTNHD